MSKSTRLSVLGIKRITLGKICLICKQSGNVYHAERFSHLMSKVNNNLTYKRDDVKPGGIAFVFHGTVGNIKKKIEDCVNKGAAVVFVPKQGFEEAELDINEYPCILLDNFNIQTSDVFAEIKESYKNLKTVAITGSLGKTTTTKFIAEIMKSHRTYDCNGRFHKEGSNRNTYKAISTSILKILNPVFKYYIQEVGAGFRDHIRICANMIRPNVFVILNVRHHHMNTYKTYEALLKDKTCIDDFMHDDGVVVANYDEESIAQYDFKHKVISFGINCDDHVDYRGTNIVQNEEFLEMDIVHNDRTEHIKVNILGTHNAYNIMAAFIAAKSLGKSEQEIANAFKNYQSTGVRQNFKNIGGRFFYLDCYNSSKDSIVAAADTIKTFPLKPGNKCLGIIGGENKLGDMIESVSIETGIELAHKNLDKICLHGTSKDDLASLNKYGDAVSVQKGLNQEGYFDTQICTSRKQLSNYLKENFNIGDIAAFKGIYLLHMPIVIDNTFGSSISFGLPNYIKKFVPVSDDKWQGNGIKQLKGMELTKSKIKAGKIVIPQAIGDYKVFRCGKKLFKHNILLREIDFGTSLRNIGEEAFRGCKGLKELTFPKNVSVIENSAFEGCSNLKKVVMKEGVSHIGARAFANCSNLEEIVIPRSVGKIEDDAFSGCKKLNIKCDEGSYACTWKEKWQY